MNKAKKFVAAVSEGIQGRHFFDDILKQNVNGHKSHSPLGMHGLLIKNVCMSSKARRADIMVKHVIANRQSIKFGALPFQTNKARQIAARPKEKANRI